MINYLTSTYCTSCAVSLPPELGVASPLEGDSTPTPTRVLVPSIEDEADIEALMEYERELGPVRELSFNLGQARVEIPQRQRDFGRRRRARRDRSWRDLVGHAVGARQIDSRLLAGRGDRGRWTDEQGQQRRYHAPSNARGRGSAQKKSSIGRLVASPISIAHISSRLDSPTCTGIG